MIDTVQGTIRTLGPATIRVAPNDSYSGSWRSLCDAVGHLATNVTDTALDVAVADAASWLWWFATPDAGVWDWEDNVVTGLEQSTSNTVSLDAVLALDVADQARWPDDIDLAELGVIRTLTPTQHRDVARMIALGGGANFSVPGAGKTTMAYTCWAALVARGEIQRAIVVAPLSAHEAWATEINDVFAPHARPNVVVRPDHPFGDVVVLNYEQLESNARLDALKAWATTAPTLVIFDEAHRVKAGMAGIRGRAARVLSQAASHRMVLTGTPRPNDAADLDNVLELAYPGRGRTLGRQHPDQLAKAYCRVTKAELQLPPLVPVTERVPLSPAHERIYDAMTDAAARAIIDDPTIVHDLERAGRIAMLLLQAATDPTAVIGPQRRLHMTGDRSDLELETLIRELPESFVPTKFVRVTQLVDAHKQAGTKVLVWAGFKSHINRLRQLLAAYQPAVVDGSVPVNDPGAPTDRVREIDRFRNDPNCTVLVATPHTLSEGISLHHTTTHQIHLDRGYNAGMFLQSLDRTHRLGLPADAHCTTTYLVAERPDGSDTIDDVVAQRLDVKVSAMGDVLNDQALGALALPDLDEQLTIEDVALGPDGAADLEALFAHLRYRHTSNFSSSPSDGLD